MRYLTYLGVAIVIHAVFAGYLAHEVGGLISGQMEGISQALNR